MYIYISLIVLFISYILFRIAAGSLNILQPNIITIVFYVQLILQTFIASILVINLLDNHYIINEVDFHSRYVGWLSVQYMMIIMPISMILINIIFSGKFSVRKRLFKYASRIYVETSSSEKAIKYAVFFLTIISILACLYTFAEIGYLPIYRLISIGSDDLIIQRIESSRNFAGSEYIRNIFAINMTPILGYAWVIYSIYKRTLFNVTMAILSFIFSINILLYDLSKSPVIIFLIGFIFIIYYSSIRIRYTHIFILILISLSIILFQYSREGYNIEDIFEYNSGPVGRLILTQAAGFYYLLDIVPSKSNYIGFSSISGLVSWMFNMDLVPRAARLAMASFHPEAVSSGEAGVMNSIFLAEAWANFGLVGIIISPIWVGFFVQILYNFFLRLPKSPIVVATFVRISASIPITGGFNDFIYPLWIFFPLTSIFFTYTLGFIINASVSNTRGTSSLILTHNHMQ